MKITLRMLENLMCPPGRKDMLVSDDDQKGHFIRVGKSAHKGSLTGKSSVVQYQKDGKTRRMFLGSLSAISLAAGREATRAILGQVALGRDPASERKEAAREAKRRVAHDALTFEALIEQWERLSLADRRKRYRTEAVRALRYAFADHLRTPAAELSRATVVPALDGFAKDGKTAMASRTAAYGRACYQWAIKRGSIEANPFANLPKAPAVKRERVLTDDEIVRIWRATEGPRSFHAIVRALLLSGQRREEVSGMARSELPPDLSTWTISSGRSKNHKPHTVPLSEPMRALLCTQPRREGTDLVFPGERNTGFSGWSKSKGSLDRRCRVFGWVLHDLRRSAATTMAELGVAPHVVEAVLNHASGHKAGVAGIYNQARYAAEKRRALDLWAAHVAALVEGARVMGT